MKMREGGVTIKTLGLVVGKILADMSVPILWWVVVTHTLFNWSICMIPVCSTWVEEACS